MTDSSICRRCQEFLIHWLVLCLLRRAFGWRLGVLILWFRLLQWYCDCQAMCSPASSSRTALPFFAFIYYLANGAKSAVTLVHICRTVLFHHRRPSCCVLKFIDAWLHEQLLFPNYCLIFQQLIYVLSWILPHKYFRLYTDLHPLCGSNLHLFEHCGVLVFPV